MNGAIRTAHEEYIIQDATPEQQEWKAVTELHHGHEIYAHRVARHMLHQLERMVEKDGWRNVLDFVSARKNVETYMRVMQVSEDHVSLGVALVQKCFAARMVSGGRKA